jgi:hypothetical protein
MSIVDIFCSKNRWIFLFFFSILFVLYLPASQAGFVADFTGLIDDLNKSTFWEHINRSHFKVKSLYHFTQLCTWLFYQIFQANHWAWHILQVSLHALNCTLLFIFSKRLFTDSGLPKSNMILLSGCLLFCVSPYVSEVIVWESAFHYLLGFLLFCCNILIAQKYLYQPKKKYVLLSALVYLLATFSIELFYISPLFILALAFYYRFILDYNLAHVKQLLTRLLLPQLVLLLLHFVLVKLAFGHWLPHINGDNLLATDFKIILSKPLKYLLQALLLLRFYPLDIKQYVYKLCENALVLVVFYTSFFTMLWVLLRKIKSRNPSQSLIALYLILTALPLSLVCGLWFSDFFWVIYDRYAYFFLGFFFLLSSLAVYAVFRNKIIFGCLILCLILANVIITFKVNLKWGATAHVTDCLMKTLPKSTDKIVLLLNVPQCMNGIAMIGAGDEQVTMQMYNLFYKPTINYPLYDVCGYNILSLKDGAHVQVLNDSTIRVTLNQWGSWWWYNDNGAISYEHQCYSVKMIDYAHVYELTLKQNKQKYLLLFQVGDKWKSVSMEQLNTEQN